MNRKAKNKKMENPLLVLETKNYCKIALESPCKHCSVDGYICPKANNSNVDWLDVIDQFSETGDGGHVVLKNGAGALGDIELAIVENALEKKLFVSITTEGVFISEKFKSRLWDLAQKYRGKLGVTVSLDGETAEIYGYLRQSEYFDKVISFIRDAKSNGLKISVNYVVHKGNFSSLQNYVDFVVNELGVEKVNLLELNSVGNAKRNGLREAESKKYFDILMNIYIEGNEKVKNALDGTFAASVCKAEKGLGEVCNGCPAGSCGMYFVRHDGAIFPCSSLELPQYHVGNVKKMSLVEANSSMEFEYAQKVAESLKIENPLVSMCPGRLESFGEQGRMEQATDMTHIITDYLKKKGIVLPEEKSCNCFSPAF